MRAYAKQRGWSISMEVRDVGSGANVRPEREAMLKAARRRELDIIVVWRLDRWGRSLLDLIGTLQELNELGVGFVSLSEALDLTTASGRALAGMLAVFAEFERVILRQGRDRSGTPRGKTTWTAAYSPTLRRKGPGAPQGRREQKRDRQASEHQPDLRPALSGALAYKKFPFLRSPLAGHFSASHYSARA